jgi:murein DD-endopeptidase MepM/ murein hydrolase activator NlpD
MELTRTIFAPFALCASLGLVVALSAAERPAAQPHTVKALDEVKAMQRVQGRLIVPVQGLTAVELSDTWGAARSNGRRHEGIDIMAPEGAPVLAAADGEIVRFWNSELGGVGIYQADADGDLVYYYAHLSARVDNLKEGDRVRQGQVIGYVGETGNATTPHLHFEIARVRDARRWWRGQELNPYPHLVSGRAPG